LRNSATVPSVGIAPSPTTILADPVHPTKLVNCSGACPVAAVVVTR